MANVAFPSSFRDPSGSVFVRDGFFYRQVNMIYREHYDFLMSSGLYDELVALGLLVPHDEITADDTDSPDRYKVLKPQYVPFISYPYEWCFSQLKHAALATLEIQSRALDHGMTLKDASSYNIQFLGGKPQLIDTLSFEKYREGLPWVAYKQFCEHFLAPLAVMSYSDIRLGQLMRTNADGIQLNLAAKLLPFRSRLKFSLLMHVHLHASAQKRFAHKPISDGHRKKVFTTRAFRGLLDSLEGAIKNLKWEPKKTEWIGYYDDHNYAPAAFQHKKRLVRSFLQEVKPTDVWDLGSNTGLFSRIASEMGIRTTSFDNDPAVVEEIYLFATQKGDPNILPLLTDLTNPSSSTGWANQERMSLLERGPADMAFALALIHHLAISNNLPLCMVADFFHKLCRWLVIEFVPKSDSQVQRLLITRDDIFPNYTQIQFEQAFQPFFTIKHALPLEESERVLYLMKAV